MFSSVSEFIAQACGGYLYARIGVKTSMSMSLAVSAVGGLLMVLFGLSYQKSIIFPILVLVAKLGISSAFNILYVCHKSQFPTLFASTSFGYCAMISNFGCSFMPHFAQVKQPLPMVTFAATTGLASLLVQNLQKIDQAKYTALANKQKRD